MNFWLDNWLDGSTILAHNLFVSIRDEDWVTSVADMVEDGMWKWDKFVHLIPLEALLKLHATPAPPILDRQTEDIVPSQRINYSWVTA